MRSVTVTLAPLFESLPRLCVALYHILLPFHPSESDHSSSPLLGAARPRDAASSIDNSGSGADESDLLYHHPYPSSPDQHGGRTDLTTHSHLALTFSPGSTGTGDGASSMSALSLLKHTPYDYACYYIPVLGWLPHYSWKSSYPSDALAGLSVAILLIPQAIAYASLAGLPPAHGLFTAIFPSIIYFLLGSSRHMSVGPESTTAIILGNYLHKILGASEFEPGSQEYLQLMLDTTFKLTLLSGLLGLGMGLIRLGFVDSILSQPVLEGFVCSIALLLLTDQIPKLFGLNMSGLESDAQGYERIRYISKNLWTGSHTTTLIISVCSFIAILTIRSLKYSYRPRPNSRSKLRRLLANLPEFFIVLMIATLISSYFNFAGEYGVAVLGDVRSGIMMPSIPVITDTDISSLLSGSLSIAIIGFIDSGIVSRMYAQKYAYNVSSNRELVALGMSNVFGAMCGGFPAYGSLTRTKLGTASGSSSQLSNLTSSFLVFLVCMFCLPFFSAMPKCVISCMICFVAWSLLDLSSLKFLIQLRDYKDATLYLSITIVVFFFGVDSGLAFAFIVCLLMLVQHTRQPLVTLLGKTPSGEYVNIQDARSLGLPITKLKDIMIVKIAGALHFANCLTLKMNLERLEQFSEIHAHPASKKRSYWNQDEEGGVVEDGGVTMTTKMIDEETGDAMTKTTNPAANMTKIGTINSSANEQEEKKSQPPLPSQQQQQQQQSQLPPLHTRVASASSIPSPIRSVVLDLSECNAADSTSIHIFLSLLDSYSSRGFLVVLVLRNAALHERLNAAGMDQHVAGVYRAVKVAVEFVEKEAKNRARAGAGGRGRTRSSAGSVQQGYESFQDATRR